MPGIDVLFLGPWDMCLSLGLNPLHQPHPEIEQVIDHMLAAGQKSGKAIGGGSATPEGIAQRLARGFTFISYGPDYSLMAAAAKTGVDAFREQADENTD